MMTYKRKRGAANGQHAIRKPKPTMRKPKAETPPVFKVWIEIEEYNTVSGSGETLDAPNAAVATFDTYEEAYEFAGNLQAFGEETTPEARDRIKLAALVDDKLADALIEKAQAKGRVLVTIAQLEKLIGTNEQQGKADPMVMRVAPLSAWQTIDETLNTDSESGAFDEALRIDIADAMAEMSDMTPVDLFAKLTE